ncbi:MAG TPA: response regulator transcription factor [Coleofasciculaceae cyanobacterium]|jgi:DNA-binding NarL/FixJ family response regulator
MIRIIVYDSNSILLAGLVSILGSLPELKIVGSFFDEASLRLLSDCAPDLLLIEQIPDEDLWWLSRWIFKTELEMAGILLTDYITSEEMREYLALGFKAFLPYLINTTEIATAIDAVMAGLIVIHPELIPLDQRNNSAITPEAQIDVHLTAREMEVLRLLGDGFNNQAIASTLQISKHTVKFHISSILSKLNVSSRTEAVTVGLRQGLIRL